MVHFAYPILKQLLDNRLYWNVVEGPLYNMLIYHTLDGAYDDFFRTLCLRPRAAVLDVGSGAGQATLRLARRYPEAFVCGIDYAATQVRIARLRSRHRKLANTEFRIGNALSIPFRDGAFDEIVSLASIKHWSDRKRGLAEIHRVLKPGGRVHIIECDGETSREEVGELARRATRIWPLGKAIAWYQEHVVFPKSPSKEELAALGENAGFVDIHVARMVGLPFLQMCMRKERRHVSL